VLKSGRPLLLEDLLLELLAVIKQLIGELSLLKKPCRDAERFTILESLAKNAFSRSIAERPGCCPTWGEVVECWFINLLLYMASTPRGIHAAAGQGKAPH